MLINRISPEAEVAEMRDSLFSSWNKDGDMPYRLGSGRVDRVQSGTKGAKKSPVASATPRQA
jgi:hypothetical protein